MLPNIVAEVKVVYIYIINTKTNKYSVRLLTFVLILLVIIGLRIKFKKNIFIKEQTNKQKVDEDIDLSKGGTSDICTL